MSYTEEENQTDQGVMIHNDAKRHRSVFRILYKVSDSNVSRVTTEIKKTFRRTISSNDSNKTDNQPNDEQAVTQSEYEQLKAKDSFVDLILTTILTLERKEEALPRPEESDTPKEEPESKGSHPSSDSEEEPPSSVTEPPKDKPPRAKSASALVTFRTPRQDASLPHIAIKVSNSNKMN